MDCPRPSYAPDQELERGEASNHCRSFGASLHLLMTQLSSVGQEWKHSCYQQCLVPVLDAISKPGLEYKAILDLDRSIRDFSVPAPLRNKEKLTLRSTVMQRASLGTALE